MITTIKHGKEPYKVGLLHGGPGAFGGMKPVANRLLKHFGILEFIQTEKSIEGQIKELNKQINEYANLPITIVGWSWGAWLGFLFTSKYPDMVQKLILVSSGAFDVKYNTNFETNRFNKLKEKEKKEVEKLKVLLNSGKGNNEAFSRIGKLLSIADSYEYECNNDGLIISDLSIFNSVWPEAAELRKTGELLSYAKNIKCPVVAFHGDCDSHPILGVEKPLTENLRDFKMIRLEKCGHTPWKEKYAKDSFYKLLIKEI
jgi:pimeloyl-ACP methyl ester carboxylesterase